MHHQRSIRVFEDHDEIALLTSCRAGRFLIPFLIRNLCNAFSGECRYMGSKRIHVAEIHLPSQEESQAPKYLVIVPNVYQKALQAVLPSIQSCPPSNEMPIPS